MVDQELSRKLAVIVHADVVDSTALVQRNETLAHQRINEAFQRFSSIIQEYGGTVHEIRGDALVAEFARASDAVCAALRFQHSNAGRGIPPKDDMAPMVRVGIALGEEVFAHDTVTGAGVVLAQRVEQLSEPGGVCVTGAIHEAIPQRLPFDQESLGEQTLKGFDEPVRVYRVALRAGAAVPGAETRRQARSPSAWRRLALLFTAGALVVIGGVVFWSKPWAPQVEPASVKRMAFPLPDKPSIAVLPFINLSGDPEQEYFVDGMTEDLITDLSKLPGIFVIARNSTFSYKGKTVKVQQVAEELGVRYVLEGSVRKAGTQVRINAQLIDATTGGHLWAERYDGALTDIFTLQDGVTQKIVMALAVNLTASEKANRAQPQTNDPEAYDAFLRGWAHYRRNTPEDFAKAVPYFEKAIERDPNYGRAYAALAAVYWSVVDKDRSTGTTTWSQALGINTEESRRQEYLNLQAAMKNPTPLAYQVASGRLARQGEYEAAIAEARRAITLDPNDPLGYQAMATALIYAGKPAEGEEQIKQAMRLDPRFPYEYLYWHGLAQFAMGRFEVAAETLTKATRGNPDDDRAFIVLAATYGHLDRLQEAKSAVEKANELRRERQQRLTDPSVQVGVDVLLAGPYTLEDVDLWPFGEQADREQLHEGLRSAGVPEEGHGRAVSPTTVAGAITVHALEAKSLFDRSATFVDVRGHDSYNDGHIPGAVHLYFKAGFSEAALSAVVAKDQEIVIYCQGPRCLLSARACAKAVAWGFKKVYYFREGFPSWKAAGYPVEVFSG